MKDINYPEDEAELMIHADVTLKKVYDLYKPINKEVLIDLREELSDDSDSELEIDDYLEGVLEASERGPPKVSKRQLTINETVRQMREEGGVSVVTEVLEGAHELETFRIRKFHLNVVRELSKFFRPEFAAKVTFSLQLIHALGKATASSLPPR